MSHRNHGTGSNSGFSEAQNKKAKAKRGAQRKLGAAVQTIFEQLERRTLLSVSAGNLDAANFNAVGKIITDFGGAEDNGNSVAIVKNNALANGDIVVGGVSNGDFSVALYSSGGSLLASTTTAIGTGYSQANAVTMDASGNIVVAGYSVNPVSNDDIAVARYNIVSNGGGGLAVQLDSNFGTGGVVTTDIGGSKKSDVANAVTIDGSGNVIVAGQSGTHALIASYSNVGALNWDTLSAGKDTANGVVVESGGNILAVGHNATHSETIELTGAGAITQTNTLNLGTNDNLTSIAAGPNGEFIVGGTASGSFVVAEVAAAGTLDSSFGTSGETTTSFASSTGSQANSVAISDVNGNEKIYLAGMETDTASGQDFFAVARYNATGTLDSAFGTSGEVTTNFTVTGSTANSDAAGIAITSDGKIIVAGTTDASASGTGATLDNIAVSSYVSNNAPTSASSTAALDSIAENNDASAGTSVATLVSRFGMTDVDGDTVGLAITAVDNVAGSWQYSTDGSTWLTITGVSATNALTLAPTALVRFQPTLGNTGTSTISVRAWDQTMGANGAASNITTNSSANYNSFSDNTFTASVYVIPTTPPPVVYVDSAWTGTTTGTNVSDGFGQHTFGVDAFATIQSGVNAVAASGTVEVDAGTYAENVTVTKSMSILGPNATIDPNTGPRVAEAVVVPAVADIESGDGGTGDTNGTIFRLGDPSNPSNAITVTIKGLTIDGNNSALPISSGRLLNGVYVDTGAGIDNSVSSYDANPGGMATTMVIENNIIENLDRYGVLGDTVNGTVAQTGAVVSNNKITNIPSGNQFGGDRGRGVAFEDNYYGTVSNNTITDVNVGYQNDNYYLPDPGGLGLVIENNTISTYHRGIFYNLMYSGASTGTIEGNNISVDNTGAGADANNFGLEIISVESGVGVNVVNNNDTGSAYGVLITGDNTTAGLTISGGILSGNKYGVYVTDNDPQFPSDGNTPNAVISGVTITGSTSSGVFVQEANGQTVGATLTGGTSINGSPVGITVSGPDASLAFSGPAAASLSGISGNYITLSNGAMNSGSPSFTPGVIDASNVTFDGFGGGNVTSLAQFYGIEDKISDYLDDQSIGYVQLSAGSVYVSQLSDQTNHNAIQRGVNVGTPGGTVNVQAGSFFDNVAIPTSLTVTGAGQGSTIVYPAISNPLGTGGGSLNGGSNVFLVQADHVTIQNLTVDGNNPHLSSGQTSNGIDVDARNGIITDFNVASIENNLNVNHVTVQNIYLRGIYAASGGTFDFEYNTVTNVEGDPNSAVAMFNYGGSGIMAHNIVSLASDALSANHSRGTTFAFNTVTDSGSGIHTDNNGDSGGVADSIHDNSVSLGTPGAYGIFVFVPYLNVSVSNNTISGVDVGLAAFGGQGGSAAFSNNSVNVNPGETGAFVTTDTLGYGQMNVSASFSGDSFGAGSAAGILIQQNPGATANASVSGVTIVTDGDGIDVAGGATAAITGSSITAGDAGIGVSGSSIAQIGNGTLPGSNQIDGQLFGITVQDTAQATINDNSIFNTFGGGGSGVQVLSSATVSIDNNIFDGGGNANGTDVEIDGGTVSSVTDNTFAATTLFIDDESTNNIDATTDTFDVGAGGAQVAGNALTVAEGFAADNKVTDYLDIPTLGYVKLNSNNVYVTQNSETTTSGAIQRGVNVATNGNTVNVQAGTYTGANVVDAADGVVAAVQINKSISLIGPNATFDPTGPAPALASQAVILPGSSDPSLDSSESVGIEITASNVTVEGITFNGSNAALTHSGGITFNGVPIDAAEGVVSYRGVGGITVSHNIIENTSYSGVDFFNSDNHAAATSDNSISSNLIQNLSDALGFGVGVILYDNFYAQVLGNVMSAVTVGVQTGNFSNANSDGAFAPQISNNQIAASGVGIFFNLMYDAASTFTVAGNNITAVNSAADAPWQGVLLGSIQGTVGVTFQNNTINGASAFTSLADPSSGYEVWNTPTTGSVLISGGTVSNVDYGVWVNTFEGYSSPADATQATVSGVNISANKIGVYIEDSAANTSHPAVNVTVNGGTQITKGGSGVGIEVSGSNASANINNVTINDPTFGIEVVGGNATITGNTITGNTTGIEFTGGGSGSVTGNNFAGATDNGTDLDIESSAGAVSIGDGNAFAGTTDYIVDLASPAQNFDLSGFTTTTFSGFNAGTSSVTPATLGTFFAIEDKLVDAIDQSGLGFIRVNSGNVFVTPNSYLAPASDDTGAIQRAIDAANSGDNIQVEAGTYLGAVNVNKTVDILGAGSTVAGSIISGGASASAVTIAASGASSVNPLTLSGLLIEGGTRAGIDLNSTLAHLLLSNVVVNSTTASYALEVDNAAVLSDLNLANVSLTTSGGVGFNVSTTGSVNGLTITGSHFDNNAYGLETQNATHSLNNQTRFTNISITGSTFNNDTFKGIYVETLDNATLNGITVNNSGTGALSPNGVNLNLKYGTYANDVIENSSFDSDATGTATGGALTIDVRNDAPSYNSDPANDTGITLSNLTFTGTSPIELSIGDNATNVSMSGLQFNGTGVGVVDFDTAASLNLGNSTFASSLAGYVIDSSLYPLGVDARNATFGSVTPSDNTVTDLYAVEDKIADGIDVPGWGLVRLRTGEIYETPSSFFTLAGTTTPSVQRAVNVASPGDTINIENGTYVGQVVVSKNLTLLGQSEGGAVIQASTSLPASFTTSAPNHPVVFIEPGAIANVEQLTVDGNGEGGNGGGGPNYRIQGIGYDDASGTVDHVTVEHVRETPLSGDQQGIAIYANDDNTTTQSVTVTNNNIFDYQKNGVALSGAGLTVDVENNTVTGAGSTNEIAQNGIQVGFGAGGLINNNTVSGSSYSPATTDSTGILIFESASGTSVTNNNISGSDLGVYAADTTGAFSITGNTISGSPGAGILVAEDPGFTSAFNIGGNTLQGGVGDGGSAGNTGDGIDAFGDISGSTIHNNLITNNSGTGIYLGGAASGDAVVDTAGSLPITSNSISGNATAGLDNESTVSVNAANNWWGTANGPTATNNSFNVGFQGDKVIGTATIAPWLTSGHNNPPAPPGFYPDPSVSFAPVSNSEGQVFGSIQAAVNGSPSGDTITVGPGTYNENVVVNKNITINGAGNGSNPATNTVVSSVSATSPVFEISGGGTTATLHGLYITGGSVGKSSGVQVDAGASANVNHVAIHDPAIGIDVAGTAFIDGDDISANDIGIRVQSSGNATVLDGTQSHDNVDGIDSIGTLLVEGASSVDNNSLCGIDVTGGSTTIDGSDVSNNGNYGIESSGTLLVRNGSTVDSNTNYGLDIEAGTATIHASSVSSNAGGGFCVDGGSVVADSGTTIGNNVGNGIEVRAGLADLTGSTVSGSTTGALLDGNGVSLTGGSFSNGTTGVSITGNGNTVTNPTIDISSFSWGMSNSGISTKGSGGRIAPSSGTGGVGVRVTAGDMSLSDVSISGATTGVEIDAPPVGGSSACRISDCKIAVCGDGVLSAGALTIDSGSNIGGCATGVLISGGTATLQGVSIGSSFGVAGNDVAMQITGGTVEVHASNMVGNHKDSMQISSGSVTVDQSSLISVASGFDGIDATGGSVTVSGSGTEIATVGGSTNTIGVLLASGSAQGILSSGATISGQTTGMEVDATCGGSISDSNIQDNTTGVLVSDTVVVGHNPFSIQRSNIGNNFTGVEQISGGEVCDDGNDFSDNTMAMQISGGTATIGDSLNGGNTFSNNITAADVDGDGLADFTDNSFVSNATGIYTDSSSQVTTATNLFDNRAVTYAAVGVFTDNSGRVSSTGDVFVGGTVGIQSSGAITATDDWVGGMVASGGQVGDGILITGGTADVESSTIGQFTASSATDNIGSQASENGFVASGGTVIILDDSLNDNTVAGVDVETGGSATVSGSAFQNTALESSSTGTVVYAGTGILENGGSLILTNNSISNTDIGVHVVGGQMTDRESSAPSVSEFTSNTIAMQIDGGSATVGDSTNGGAVFTGNATAVDMNNDGRLDLVDNTMTGNDVGIDDNSTGPVTSTGDSIGGSNGADTTVAVRVHRQASASLNADELGFTVTGIDDDGTIHITSTDISNARTGINVESDGTATVSGGTISNGGDGVDSSGSLQMTDARVIGMTSGGGNKGNGIEVDGGTATISGGTIGGSNVGEGNVVGISVSGGTVNISADTTNSPPVPAELVDNTTGIVINGGKVIVDQSAVVNGTTGILVEAGQSVTIQNGSSISGATTGMQMQDNSSASITDSSFSSNSIAIKENGVKSALVVTGSDLSSNDFAIKEQGVGATLSLVATTLGGNNTGVEMSGTGDSASLDSASKITLPTAGVGVLFDATADNETFTGGTISDGPGATGTTGILVSDSGGKKDYVGHVSLLKPTVAVDDFGNVTLTGDVIGENTTGVLVESTGNATIGTAGAGNGNDIYGNTTGIEVTAGGIASVTDNDFNNATAGPANGIDLKIDNAAGAVTIGDGNQFAGTSTIENLSNQAFDLSSYTATTFAGTNLTSATLSQLYGIEDTIVDAIDVGSFGLVRLVADNIYVTPNSFFAPTTTTPSIQRGVDAATASDTVNVEAGDYTDSVSITKALTLKGAQAGVHAPSRSGPETFVDGGGISVVGAKATIDGFTIENVTSSNPLGTGLYLAPSSAGSNVLNDIFTGNIFGLYLNADGSALTTVSQNLFLGNDSPGPANGNSIYSDQNAENILIDSNTFNGPGDSALVLAATPSTINNNVTVSNNIIENEDIFLLASTNVTISSNISTGVDGGVVFGGGDSNDHVFQNSFTGSSFSGVELGDFYGFGPNSGVDIHNNFLDNNDTGVLVDAGGLTGTLAVNNNHISGNATAGVENDSTATVDATANWWGSVTGPTVASNPGGTGDKIVGSNVLYSPWLTSGVDLQPAVPGFQPTSGADVQISGNSSVFEGNTYTLNLNPTNPGSPDITGWVINWGDGTIANPDTQMVTGDPATVTHTYAEENSYTISATASTNSGPATSNNVSVTVNDAPLTDTTPVGTYSAVEGNSTGQQILATFSDGDPSAPLSDYTPIVNWGGMLVGAPSVSVQLVSRTGSVSNWEVLGTATYAEKGTYTVSVTVNDVGGSTTSTSNKSFSVADAALTDTSTTETYNSIEGVSTGSQILATFSDGDPFAPSTDYTPIVNWGGTLTGAPSASVQLVSRTATVSNWEVLGNATYAADGTYNVSVTVNDNGGSTVSSSGKTSIVVADAVPTVALSGSFSDNTNPTPNVAEGSTFTLTLAPVVDTGYAGGDRVQDYFINWGDGSAEQEVPVASIPQLTGGTVTHVYQSGESNSVVPKGTTTPNAPIQVDLLTTDNYFADAGALGVVVYDVSPTASFSGSNSVVEGNTGSVTFFNQFDPSSVDTAAGFTYSYDFNDSGNFSAPGDIVNSSSPNATVPASFLSTPGTVTVRGRISDIYGGFTDYLHTITVTNVAPTVAPLANVNTTTGTAWTEGTPLNLPSFTDPGNDAPWLVYVNYNYDPINNPGLGTLVQSGPSKTFPVGTTYANTGTYTVRVTVEDLNGGPLSLSGTGSFTVNVTPSTFHVTNFSPTSTGFDVQFNRAANLNVLNLYKGLTPTFGTPDVTLTGPNGPVKGSLVWNASTDTASFVQTGGVLTTPGTYTATLVSGTSSFEDLSGNTLQGNDISGNYVTSFNVSAPGDVLSLPYFSRGPGQSINLPATSSAGIPISLSDGTGVDAVDFDISYDPTLFTITGLNPGLDFPHSGWSITTNNTVPGDFQVSVSGISTLGSGSKTLLDLIANVPANATYGAGEEIKVTNLRINEGAIAATADAVACKVALIGDAAGVGFYDPFSAHLISNVVVGNATGFDAYPLFDPVIVGDVTGDGTLSGQDASDVAQKSIGLSVPQIPAIPPGFSPITVAPGVDPQVTVASNVLASPGGMVTVPISIDDATQLASGLFNFSYDGSALTLTDATLGTLDASNWSVGVNPDNGSAYIYNNGNTPPSAGPGTIANLVFSVAANAPLGVTPVTISGGDLFSNSGQLVMTTSGGSVLVHGPLVLSDNIDYVRLDGQNVDIWHNATASGAPAQSILLAAIDSMSYAGPAGGDLFILDLSNGQPLPSSGLSFTGGSGQNTLEVIGTTGNDNATVNGSTFNVTSSDGTDAISYTGANNLIFDGDASGTDTLTQAAQPGGGASLAFSRPTASDTLNVNAGNFTVPAGLPGGGQFDYTLGTATVASGAKLALAQSDVLADQTIFTVNTLTDSGTMDITNNTVFVDYGNGNPSPMSGLKSLIVNGYASGAWNGTGINSSSVAAQPPLKYGIGYADGADGLVAGLQPGQIEITPALLGDANLSGKVNFSDFLLLSAGLHNPNSSWDQGDFNYDGSTTFYDFLLMSSNNGQSSTLVVPANQISANVVVETSSQNSPAATSTSAGASETLFSNQPISSTWDNGKESVLAD